MIPRRKSSNRQRLPAFAISLIGAIALCSPQTGCQSDVDERIELALLGQDCLVNSDCEDPYICAFQLCHSACEASRDCPDGARCVTDAGGHGVCQLEDERRCERTRDCPKDLICGGDGECRNSCASDNQCVEQQRCVSGSCADVSELNDEGNLSVASTLEQGAEGAPCRYVSDCAGVLLCRDQVCLPECRQDRDCASGKTCEDERCVDEEGAPKSCSRHSDCIETGQLCLDKKCLCECAEDRDCPSGRTCAAPEGSTVPCECVPSENSCQYNSDCTKPGQKCRDHLCSDECLESTDCADGWNCIDGACVEATRIVVGNVEIKSALQLERYRGVQEIVGNLTIQESLVEDFAGALDDLEKVSGTLGIYQNSRLSSVSLRKLERVQILEIFSAPALTRIELPQLATVDAKLNLYQVGTIEPVALELPRLAQLGSQDSPGQFFLSSSRIADLDSVGFAGGKPLRWEQLGYVNISANAPLTDCVANAFIESHTVEGFSGGAASGNVPCEQPGEGGAAGAGAGGTGGAP